MSDDDRPKKSWKEIDAVRDRSGGGARRPKPEERAQERAQKSQAYSKYKTQLDKLFTPGMGAALPESLKSKLGPTDPEVAKKQELTRALQEKADRESLDAFLGAGLSLPEDLRLLMRLLDLREPELLKPVLSALARTLDSGKKPNRMLFVQKLDAILAQEDDDEVVALCNDLKNSVE